MSHLRPLTVTWFSGGVGVEDNLQGLHTEEATAFLPCPPAPQRGPSWLGRCPLRPTKGGGPREPGFCCKPEGQALLCSLSFLLLFWWGLWFGISFLSLQPGC